MTTANTTLGTLAALLNGDPAALPALANQLRQAGRGREAALLESAFGLKTYHCRVYAADDDSDEPAATAEYYVRAATPEEAWEYVLAVESEDRFAPTQEFPIRCDVEEVLP